MSDRDNWTLEQWKTTAEWSERDLREERREHANTRVKLTDEINLLRYAVKGICADRLTLSVNIDPIALAQSKDVWDMAQFMVRHHALRSAHEIEQRLGERHELLEAFDEARSHINYLERHATSRGLAFTPFAMKEKVFR